MSHQPLTHKFIKTIAAVMVLLFCGTNCVQAQLTQRNLFKPFTEDYIQTALGTHGEWRPFPATASEWQKLLPDTVIKKIIAFGEKSLKEAFPNLTATDFLQFTRTKNRSEYERVYNARRRHLWSLVMAELVDGKNRFADQIANDTWAICEESFWGLPAHIQGLADVDKPYVDLFAAETASLLAWTYYFTGNKLDHVSKQLKPRISSEIKRRIFDPLSTATTWAWMGGGDPNKKLNNWAPWIMSNYIETILLLEKDEKKKAVAVKKGMNLMDQYINGLGDDGACDEGPIYWTASVACVFDALTMLNDASSGKINIYNDPFLNKAASYFYRLHISEKYFVNVADAEVKMDADGLDLFRIGREIDDSTLTGFSEVFKKSTMEKIGEPMERMISRRLYNLLALDKYRNYPGQYNEIRDSWMPGIQMMCTRSDNGFFVASHGGHNAESHNHNDVGDFIVYLNGTPLILDAGRGTYTARTFSNERYSLWFNTSAYHNLPMIGGIQQKDGIQYAAKDVSYQHTKKVSSVTMDLAAAYPAETGLESLQRTVALHKKGWVEVTDKYSIKNATTVSQSFMTVCDADVTAPGKIGFKIPDQTNAYLYYDASLWSVEKKPVELNTEEDEDIRKAWEGQTIFRISLTSKKPVKQVKASYTIKLK